MKRTFHKKEWKNVEGASEKAKRLKLQPDINGAYLCPLSECDSNAYKSQRGCRKHVTEKHGWYFFFDEKPKIEDKFPEKLLNPAKKLSPTRTKTWDMPSFSNKCRLAQDFVTWISSAGGGGKDKSQADQIIKKILKFAKYCCSDLDESCELTKVMMEYCIGDVKFIERFVIFLETECKMGKPGIISYLQSLAHCLDFLRYKGIDSAKVSIFMTSEVFLSRAKQCLRKQMRVEWNTLFTIETLESKNSWATLVELQAVLPFHEARYEQILKLIKIKNHSSRDLSFATSFIVAMLFLKVKSSRPMTFQFITIPMLNSIKEDGMIDQTKFKTNSTYSFDSLLFEKTILEKVKLYVEIVRPKFNPSCQYLLVNGNGTQLKNLGDIFGRMVYQAIGKYVNPTRYRQIIETESAERLSTEEQAIVSLDQKHTSNVAKVHYQKQKSRDVARKASECMKILINNSPSSTSNDDQDGPKETEYVENTTDISSDNSGPNVALPSAESPGAKKPAPTAKSPKITQRSPTERKAKSPFTTEEDDFLLKGLRKYGQGKWTRILKDPDFVFHSSRTNATLMTRAKVKHLI